MGHEFFTNNNSTQRYKDTEKEMNGKLYVDSTCIGVVHLMVFLLFLRNACVIYYYINPEDVFISFSSFFIFSEQQGTHKKTTFSVTESVEK